MKKIILEVGTLVKNKWDCSSKVDEWKKKTYNLTNDLFIPPMGIIKNIKTVTKYKIHIVDKEKQKIPYQVQVAEVDWSLVKIPEINAETNKWQLEYCNQHCKEIELKYITPYETYYKSLLKRKLKKTT